MLVTARVDTNTTRPAVEAGEATVPVYLVHWNAPDWLRSSIVSLRESVGCEPRIVVIDNSGTLDAEFDPGVTIISSPVNDGYTGGANRALADCPIRFPDAKAFVVAAHDLHVSPNSLSALLTELEANPLLGIVGPVLNAPAESFGGTWDGRRAGRLTQPGDPQWLSGTMLMIRRECSDAVGLFDTSFGSYSEDVDYGLRAKDLGWSLAAVPAARAHGLGSVADDVNQRIDLTNLRLAVKRGGRRVLAQDVGSRLYKLQRVAAVSLAYGICKKSTRVEARAAFGRRVRELRAVLAISPALLRRPQGSS